LPDRAPSLTESGDFRPSLCVAPCCRLPLFVATKGQEKGNVMTSASAQARAGFEQGHLELTRIYGLSFW
jgi:hypothetical protein